MTEIRGYAPDTNPSYPNGYADTNPLVKQVRIRSLGGTPFRGFPTQNTRMRIVRTHEPGGTFCQAKKSRVQRRGTGPEGSGTKRGQCKTMPCKSLTLNVVTGR